MEKLIVTEEFYIDPRLQEEIEQQLLELPIVQYAWLPAKELTFSENVRKICREECLVTGRAGPARRRSGQ